MTFSFFGLVIKPGKSYTQKVSRPFRITMATYGEKVTEGDRSCVKVEVDGEVYVLCALSASRVEQQPLDIVFEVNDKVTFSTSGENVIYLTGNYLPDENDEEYESGDTDSEEVDSEECEDELDSDEEISEDTLNKLRAAIGKHASFDSDDDDDDDSDFVELEAEEDEDESNSSDISEVEHENEETDSDKAAESDEAMGLDSDEEESTAIATGSKRKAPHKSPQQSEKKLKDNAAAAIPASSAKSPAKKVEKLEVAAPVSSATDADSTPKKTPEDNASQTKVAQSAPPKTAAAATATPSRQVEVPTPPNTEQKTKRQRKAERKKARMAAMADAGTVAATVGDKNNKLNENSTAVSPKKTFDNGLIVEDVKVGNGTIAAKGKKVTVRYVGKLVKNGKVFDKNVNGKPFSFSLGAGEVIKGWDLGFEHMRVGGERRLIIPGPLAYGSRGAPPDIPKNAALEFEVKLLKVE